MYFCLSLLSASLLPLSTYREDRAPRRSAHRRGREMVREKRAAVLQEPLDLGDGGHAAQLEGDLLDECFSTACEM